MYQKAANYIGVTVRKCVFVFLQYNINRSKGVFWAKVLLNLASEGLKYPPEVRVEHKTCSSICGTPVQCTSHYGRKFVDQVGRGVREGQNMAQNAPYAIKKMA